MPYLRQVIGLLASGRCDIDRLCTTANQTEKKNSLRLGVSQYLVDRIDFVYLPPAGSRTLPRCFQRQLKACTR